MSHPQPPPNKNKITLTTPNENLKPSTLHSIDAFAITPHPAHAKLFNLLLGWSQEDPEDNERMLLELQKNPAEPLSCHE